MTSYNLLLLTYNRLNVNIRCLQSILRHSPTVGCTIHILDNASTDNTGLWLLQLARTDPRVKVYLQRENLGVAGGRQYLLDHAKGDIVGFLDSDVDIYEAGWLDTISRKLQNKKIGVVGQAGHKIYPNYEILPFSPDYEGPCHVLSGYSQFFRLKDLKRNHIQIDQQFNYGGCEDDDFCFQWLKAGYQNHKIKLPIQHEFSGTWDGKLYPKHRQLFVEKWWGKITL